MYGDDEEMTWTARVWQLGVTLQDLQVTEERMVSLSRKLATERFNTCPTHIKTQTGGHKNRLARIGTMCTGPQILWFSFRSFEFDDCLAGARAHRIL